MLVNAIIIWGKGGFIIIHTVSSQLQLKSPSENCTLSEKIKEIIWKC